ncbi:efflux RND transporter permease subunit [Neobacillus sp. D3-1R]|uniref:efflux RND transporter permease subunit n=1 Tax=Neobacillus sp. D3-1R TaxID=3445778 RepID=UPI003FA09D67
MNKIINFALKNKFAVWLLTIIITVAGLYSGFNMKLETLPDITIPVVTITTPYPGATPEEVADQISEPLEKRLQNLKGVKAVSSSSFQNASALQIEYTYQTDMEEAKREVDEIIADMTFPEGALESKVSRISFNAFPILAVSVANDKKSLSELTSEVEDEILPAIEGLEGVSSVQISGQQVEEAQLQFKEDQLKALGLNKDTVQNIIKGSNVNMPLGLYTFKDTQKAVVVDGNIMNLEDLKKMKIPVIPTAAAGQGNPGMMPQSGTNQGNPGAMPQTGMGQSNQASMPQATPGNPTGQQGSVTPFELPTVELQDIADIKIVGKAESISRTNGQEAIALQIVKAADANTVDVANAVKDKINQLEDQFEGTKFIIGFDQGEPIEKSVETMLNKALFGAVFAIIIILLFLRSFKSTIISVISIPLSLLIAILLLKQMDITLNIMTLGAMTVAIGRVIDDSIVVIENIYRRMSLSKETLSGKDLIREATKEMFIPILSSTIVTVAVFLPLGLVKGQIGELFLPFALTVVFALLASLLVAITIVPMMAHTFFKKGLKHKHEQGKPGKLALFYKGILNWSLNHKIITFGLAILLLLGSFFLVPIIGVSFLPSEEEKMAMVTFKPAPGQTLEDVEELALDAESFFLKRKNVETVQYSVGGENPMNPGANNQALFYVIYDKDTENFETEKENVVKELQSKTEKGEWESQDFTGGTGNKVSYFVYGEKVSDLEPTVKKIEEIMKKNDSFRNVDTSISQTYDEYTLVVDQEKLSKLGLTTGQIGMELMQQRQRPVVTTIEKDGEKLNVYLEVAKQNYEKINDLTDKTITSPLGQTIKIEDVVKINEGKTSDTVTRRDGKIYVSVSGELTTKDVSKASKNLQKEVDKLEIPSNIEVKMGGVTEDIQESFTQLGLAMLAAIAIVYIVLVITFGGALAPFAILFSLPFSIIGGLVGLLIAGETLSISAMIGALMLIGIVVTNAIVLVDRVIHKENEGYTTREALLEAGVTRLRPILMTAIATIGALIPLALGIEGSGVISRGLGVTVIGGLTSSTLLTLLIVPIVYETLTKLKRGKRRSAEKMM